jgi:hypothetical protein
MKFKSLLILALLGLSFSSIGQISYSVNQYSRYSSVSYPSMQWYFPVKHDKGPQYIKERGIDSVVVLRTEITKKGKEKQQKYRYRYMFNGDGNVVRFESAKRNKPTSNRYDYLQGEKDKRESIQTIKGKFKESKTMLENKENGQYSRLVYVVNSKGDTASKRILGPMDTVSFTSKDYYYKKGKLVYTWHNEFYPNKSKKRTALLNKKGKEKFVWDYQCKDEGVEIKKHKDTSTVCISKEYGKDSVLTEVHHTIYENGEIGKTIYKYNKKHQMMLYKLTSGPDDKLVYNNEYEYGSDYTTVISKHTRHFVKGKLSSENMRQFDDNGDEVKNVSRSYKKGKLTSEHSVNYRYDAMGRPAKKISTDVTDGSKSVWYYKYN